jgi:hypothetical protein
VVEHRLIVDADETPKVVRDADRSGTVTAGRRMRRGGQGARYALPFSAVAGS